MASRFDKAAALACLFISMACMKAFVDNVAMQKELSTMRVKDFDDKIDETPEMIWFHGLFARTLATEGKRVDATARLQKLCRIAYNLGSNADLEEEQPPQEPEPAPEATDGGDEAEESEYEK